MTEYHRQFTKILNQIDHSRRTYELFFDFNSLFAYSLALPFYPQMAKERLKPLHERYGTEKLAQFDQLADLTVRALEDSHRDFLGELYSMLEFGDQRTGQFFTPYHLSLMTAQMTLVDVETVIRAQGFVTVAEPACGAGGMVVAVRQVLIEKGFNPSTHAYIEMTDLSEICFLMSYIQISLYGMAANVIHGDSLLMKRFKALHTPVYFLNAWPLRLMREHIPPPTENQPGQISLGL